MCRSLSSGFSQPFKRVQMDDVLLGRLAVRGEGTRTWVCCGWKSNLVYLSNTLTLQILQHTWPRPLSLGREERSFNTVTWPLLATETSPKPIPFIDTQWALQGTSKWFSCSTSYMWNITWDFSLKHYIEFGGANIHHKYKFSYTNIN